MNLFLKENKQLLLLALPLIVNYFIEGCPNFINNAMIAHLGQTELAAGAIVSSAFTTMIVFFYGLLSAASTLISHHYGEKKNREIGEVIRDACVIGIFCSILLIAILANGGALLRLMGQSEALIILATPYLHGLIFAVIPDFGTMILWQFFIGLGRPKVTLVSSILYVPINILANYTLMFGKFGFPQLDMLGIGLGTAFAYTVLFIGFIVYIFFQPQYRGYFNLRLFNFQHWHINSLIKVGLPMGIIWMIDLSFSLFAASFAGKLSTLWLAAQQVSVQAAGLTFMVVAGLSQAISIRIGHTWHSNNVQVTKMICGIGVLICCFIPFLFSLIFWFRPLWIIGIDFDLSAPQNVAVIKLATEFLAIFGFYQIINSLRYAFFSALRAMKDTYFSALCSLIGFYGIAIGCGYFLLFHWHGTLFQFWYLTIFALCLIVVALYGRLRHHLKRRETAALS
ncbi:MAG: MATE family efflux transporter [Gammaproteobacteria bacterium]|nr:MATE family efflux transporter [Gammaproteobacteria bacterium]